MCSHIKSKAQVLLPDFVFSLAIFIVLICIVFFMGNVMFEKSENYKETYMVENLAKNIGYYILSYTGNPENWDPHNVKMIGFSTGKENVINFTKLMFLSSMPYNKSKRFFMPNEEYHFFINITYFNNTKSVFSYGKYPYFSQDVFKITRIGILNQTVVRVEIYVWK